jgi:hypothetical protein
MDKAMEKEMTKINDDFLKCANRCTSTYNLSDSERSMRHHGQCRKDCRSEYAQKSQTLRLKYAEEEQRRKESCFLNFK